MSGWVKLHRAVTEWEWYTDANTVRVFLHLLLKANYESSRYMGIEVPVGSLPTGRKSIALSLRLTEDKVRTSLKRLAKTKEITQQNFPKFSIITICNWEQYQSDPQQIPSKSPANPQQIPTLKETKNKRTKEIPMSNPDFENFWSVYPKFRQGSKKEALKAFENAVSAGNSPSKIIEAAILYSKSDEATKDGGKFAKGTAAWLNGERFNNSYKQPGLFPSHQPTRREPFKRNVETVRGNRGN